MNNEKKKQIEAFLPIALSLIAAVPQRTEDWLRFRDNRNVYMEKSH